MYLAGSAQKKDKTDGKRTLETVKTEMKTLLGGTVGSLLVEGLQLVETGAREGRKALSNRLGERITTISNEASAARGEVEGMKSAVETATSDASEAKSTAAKAASTATEAQSTASAVKDDFARVSTAAEEAKSTAGSAKSTAEGAAKQIAALVNALKIKVNGKGGAEPKELEGAGTIAFIIKAVADAQSSVAGFLQRVAKVERKQGELEAGQKEVSDLLEEVAGQLIDAGIINLDQTEGEAPEAGTDKEGGA
jgi:chromosome segregation ATPase